MDRIRICTGDITQLAINAIVNAANEALLGGGGVDGAIHRGAGPELLTVCRAFPEVKPGVRCPTGESRITPGFNLPAKFVIHTVGPIWQGGDESESELLAGCYRSALKLAIENEAKTIAFPAISCGVYRFPLHGACKISVDTIADVLRDNDSITEVSLVAFDEEVFNAWRDALHVAREKRGE